MKRLLNWLGKAGFVLLFIIAGIPCIILLGMAAIIMGIRNLIEDIWHI